MIVLGINALDIDSSYGLTGTELDLLDFATGESITPKQANLITSRTEKDIIKANKKLVRHANRSSFFNNVKNGLGDPAAAKAAIGTSNILTQAFGSQQGLDDERSDVKMGIDTLGLSAMSAMALKGGGFGIAAGIMAGNQVINSLFQTDSKTTADAIMNSSLMPAPLTMINKMTALQTNAIAKDNSTWAASLGQYGGSESIVDEAIKKKGEYGGVANLFGNGLAKANAAIDKANRQQWATKNIVDEGRDLMESSRAMSYTNSLNYEILMNGGVDPRYMYAARHGMKINPTLIRLLIQNTRSYAIGGQVDPLELGNGQKPSGFKVKIEQPPTAPLIPQPTIKPSIPPIENTDPLLIDLILPTYLLQFYKKGGEINIIPEGALHARKHDIDMEGITKKGIPVIDNDGEQLAEIENSEIIFRLEVTEKLEKLSKKFSEAEGSDKDDIALEAGKILTCEIMTNTLDNTNKLL